MVEAMDTEIGRLLVELGLANWNRDGTLNYQPEKTNTVVVVMGDNGTYVNSVKFTAPGPFDPTRAQAFPYHTGEIGRASGRHRVCEYVEILRVAKKVKKNNNKND